MIKFYKEPMEMLDWDGVNTKLEQLYKKELIPWFPYSPKDNEIFWTVNWNNNTNELFVDYMYWTNDLICCSLLKTNNCFKTRIEATNSKYTIYKRLTGKSWEE